MTINEAEKIISELVKDLQGCKATELAARLASTELIKFFETEQIIKIIDNMILAGDLMEIQYTLPALNYRIKTFILPKDTKIEITRP